MTIDIKAKGKACCSTEHARLMTKLDACDRRYKNPADWHRCARVTARHSGRRARECMLRN